MIFNTIFAIKCIIQINGKNKGKCFQSPIIYEEFKIYSDKKTHNLTGPYLFNYYRRNIFIKTNKPSKQIVWHNNHFIQKRIVSLMNSSVGSTYRFETNLG